jgi:O-antigen ligase
MGRGYSSALYILPTHPDLFTAAAHAHSLYLEQLFSGGIVGLGLFVSCIVITLALAWRAKAAQECSILIFFLVYGITEPEISGPVSFPILIVFFAIASILVESRSPTRLRQAYEVRDG